MSLYTDEVLETDPEGEEEVEEESTEEDADVEPQAHNSAGEGLDGPLASGEKRPRDPAP